jgi:N4-gp56 family major capsid protein
MWVWDAPTGVYKNHQLSSKIREAAVADALFMRYVSPEPNYGKGRGQSANITRVMQLPLAGRVSETERLPTGRPVVDTKQVTVSEWGFKTELTEFEESLTHFDLRSKFQRMLRDQMRLTMDKMVADALLGTPIKAVSTSATAVTFETVATGTRLPVGTATNNISIAHLRQIKDYLTGDLKAPPFKNGMYIGICSTKAARGIKNDAEYKDWQSPTTMAPFTDGRLRDVEGIALFETNHVATSIALRDQGALVNAMGAGLAAGEAIFFGADAGFLATATDPELRVGIAEDLGRFRQIGWYGILEAGLTWGETANTARAIHFASVA